MGVSASLPKLNESPKKLFVHSSKNPENIQTEDAIHTIEENLTNDEPKNREYCSKWANEIPSAFGQNEISSEFGQLNLIVEENENFTLESIPNFDLGESLDGRDSKSWSNYTKSKFFTNSGQLHLRINESIKQNDFVTSHRTQIVDSATSQHNQSTKLNQVELQNTQPFRKNDLRTCSEKSFDSNSYDSGVYDLEFITENSSLADVKRVEREFAPPPQELDLTIRGVGCTRLLSGSQKNRLEEQEIMKNLRQEGFITTAKEKCSGGVAFEVVEATPVIESAGGRIRPRNFLPQKHKERLEKQIEKFKSREITTADVNRRQFLAEERRKLGMDAKLEKLSTLLHKNSREDKIEQLIQKKIAKEETAISNREAHLKELRDKLNQKNKKSQQIKLKKLINGAPIPILSSETSENQLKVDYTFS